MTNQPNQPTAPPAPIQIMGNRVMVGHNGPTQIVLVIGNGITETRAVLSDTQATDVANQLRKAAGAGLALPESGLAVVNGKHR